MNIHSIKKFKSLVLKIIAATAFASVLYSCNTGSSSSPAPAASPSISFSPTSGRMGTLITITSTNTDLANPISVSVGGVDAIVLESSSTSITVFSLSSSTGAVVVTPATGSAVTADSDFTFSAASPIATQQGSKLVGTANINGATLGGASALSADGNTAIVGGYQDNSGVGAAWVFQRTGGVWAQQGSKLAGTGNVGSAGWGYSVAISADGNTALVGGYTDNTNEGAAWVFTRTAGVWTQQGSKLVGTGNTGAANLGYSVALSADGNTALVGGIADNSYEGAAWVFTRTAGVWTQQGSKLVGTGNTGAARQGISVALSADGNTALIGGYIDNTNEGAAWVFTRTAGVWSQQGAKLVGTGNTGAAYQGTSVSLSADGNTALVGGYQDNTNQGAVWIFTRTAGVWTQQGSKLVGTGNVGGALQGYSAKLSADGNIAIVGGSDDNGSAGAAWLFTRTAGVWTQQGSKLVGTGTVGNAQQGWSVALSADGHTALVGGVGDNGNDGAAWVFVP